MMDSEATPLKQANRISGIAVTSEGKVRPIGYKTKHLENFKRFKGQDSETNASARSLHNEYYNQTSLSESTDQAKCSEIKKSRELEDELVTVDDDFVLNPDVQYMNDSEKEKRELEDELVTVDDDTVLNPDVQYTNDSEKETRESGNNENEENECVQSEEDTKEASLVAEVLQQLESECKWTENDQENQEQSDMDDSDDHDEVQKGTEPIQPGHHLTVTTSVLLIWIYVITHSLTTQQLSDLLALINIHLLIANPALKSVHHFKKFFSQLRTPMKRHYFCMNCYGSVKLEDVICSNAACGKNLRGKKSTDFFIELDIKEQLTNLFSRPDFRGGLRNRGSRIKKHQNNIEDIYDGLLYKNMSKEGGPLHEKNINNLTFTLNTDGVPIFKSSNTSVWPIFLMVNELPYKMRKLRDNMILCGLWYGHDKPIMNLFLDPLRKCLVEFQNGTELLIGNEKITVKAYLFCLSCDTPARSAVLNMNQHNGDSSCPKCLQTGMNVRTAKGGNIRVFPFQTSGPHEPERQGDQMKHDAENANKEKVTVRGMKGPSVLMFIPSFDSVKNVGIDYMHLLYLGIVRLLLKLWFSVQFSSEGFSLYSVIDVVDSRIQKLKPSHFITRSPRTISDHLKFWKAAEVRSWFLYYSIPCIRDLIKPLYLYHYCALVEAIFLLSQSSISEEDIMKSERLLNYFVFMFSSLYDDRYLTLNMHCLLHLPQTVRELGPLWSYSCFSFEGANGDLIKMFHGTQYIDTQIVNAVHVFQMLPSLTQDTDKNSIAYKFIQTMIKTVKECEPNSLYFCGKGYTKDLSNTLMAKFCEYVHGPVQEICFHKRAVVRGLMYHSLDYTRVTKRNSFTVKYISSVGSISFGFIQSFAHVKTHREDFKIAIIKKLNRCDINLFDMHFDCIKPDDHVKANFMNITIPFVHFVQESASIHIVPLSDIVDLCICIDCDKFMTVCEEPNHHELNL